MIGDLKPYAQYKDSGLLWLGQVPAHWSVSRIKAVLRETDRRSEDGQGTLLSLTRVRGLIPHREMTDKMHSAKTLAGYKRYRAGQLVMNRMQAWSGMFGAGETDGLVSPDYAVFDIIGGHSIKLVLERLKTPDLVSQFALESKGIGSGFNRLYTDRFGPIPISLPPPDEQAAIVRFLDWANGRLERAIRAKRKVIALLNEQKQAIIHRAVTRGLDPDVPLKPSGIPWLGDIPQHWEMRRLSSVAHFRSGKAHEQFVSESGDHICVTARFVSTAGKSRKLCAKNVCPATKGDVLMVMSDLPNGRALARAYLVRDDSSYAVNQRVCALTAHSIDPRMLAYWANRNWHLLRNDDGLNQTHLSNYDYKTMPVVVPPPEEQERIAAWLDEATSHADVTSDRLARECELISEYRTRLVADVVTGKLDVREAAARLPNEATPDFVEAEIAEELDSEAEEAAA